MSFSINQKKRFRNKYSQWALVTGATSGIGQALAQQIAGTGMDIILVARQEDRLNAQAAELSEQFRIQTLTIRADLSKAYDLEQLLIQTADMDVGLLVAAAGFGTSGELIDTQIDEEVNMIDLNVTSVFKLTHHFAPLMAARGRGGIILLSSLVGFQGTPYAANYAATKAYVQTLGEALYLELKPKGVDVLAAAPGPVATGFAQRANMQMGQTLKPNSIAVEILKALGKKGTVLPGFLTKFLVYSLRMLPRFGKVRIMRLVMGGMTKHQRS